MCAAALRQRLRNKLLRRSILACCPETPLLGSKFCWHHATEQEDNTESHDYEIVDHEKLGPIAADDKTMKVLIRKKDSEETLWVSEDSVLPGIADAYFKAQGAIALDALHARKKLRILVRQADDERGYVSCDK